MVASISLINKGGRMESRALVEYYELLCNMIELIMMM